MTTGILGFALGIVWLQWQPELPSAAALAWLAAGGALLVLAGRRWHLPVFVGAALLGVAWAGHLAQVRLADQLPETSEGQEMVVTGVVSALPQAFENGWRFEFEVEQASLPAPRHISLAWYRSPLLDDEDLPGAIPGVHAGERWRFTVRLKRPHGNLNPNGFDFEAWLLEQGIRATGYVRPRGEAQRLEAFVPGFGTVVEALRENIRQRFNAVLPAAPYAGILVALAIGDQRAIPAEQWQAFSRTGLTHLLSVSGLHITMVAGLVWALVNWLWRRSPRLMLRLPAQQAAAVGGLLAALAYCL
ncbi:MAG TPA: ComEC/Rec2 family competence protein, partial [Rhodocyclaceae bacterium]